MSRREGEINESLTEPGTLEQSYVCLGEESALPNGALLQRLEIVKHRITP